MDCYDDSVPCQVFNIVDGGGKKDGFTTFVETMMEKLVDAGACWYPYHELTAFSKTDSGTTELSFANGVTATVEGGPAATILNIPQRPLLNVVRNSNLDEVGMLDSSRLDALHSVQTVIATKFYLYYPKGSVFWRKLGIVSGDFESDGDARSMLLAGRYHGRQYVISLSGVTLTFVDKTVTLSAMTRTTRTHVMVSFWLCTRTIYPETRLNFSVATKEYDQNPSHSFHRATSKAGNCWNMPTNA